MAAASRHRPTGAPGAGGRGGGPADGEGPGVLLLDQVRIEAALQGRQRYKYVHPRVLREGQGWRIVSPNCSRNIDPTGGEIDIAWLVPAHTTDVGARGGWLLHARDHALRCWTLKLRADTLAEALVYLVQDERREFWQ